MKTKVRLLLLLAVTLLLSQCDDDDKSKDCDKTTFIKGVVNTHGTVRFNTVLDAYAITVTIPGTYDSQDIGLVCNLQKELQKNDLEVTFDGNYFQYTGGAVPEIAGQTYYYLELDKITPQ